MHKIVTGCYVLQPDNLPLSDKGVHRILQLFAAYSDLTALWVLVWPYHH